MKIVISEAQYMSILEGIPTFEDIPQEDLKRLESEARVEFENQKSIINDKKDLNRRYQNILSLLSDPSDDEVMKTLNTIDERNRYYKLLEKEALTILNKLKELQKIQLLSYDEILKRKKNQFIIKLRDINIKNKKELSQNDLMLVIEDVIDRMSSQKTSYFAFDYNDFDKEVKNMMENEDKSLAAILSEHIFNGGNIEFLIGKYINKRYIDEIGREREWKWETEKTITINMDDVLEGITETKNNYPDVYENILRENSEFNDHHIFFQNILFKEVIYK